MYTLFLLASREFYFSSQQEDKMKSTILKASIQFKVFRYFLHGLFQYLAEPILRIFSPNDDLYPAIGVQPYEGDYYSKWR